MITIVNYRMGNIRSVQSALEYLGTPCQISGDPRTIERSDMLILPGVGSFRVAMQNLTMLGMTDALHEAVLIRKRPILGICLGMQLLADEGTEDGITPGLGWIPGRVVRFAFDNPLTKVPHIGFNSVHVATRDPLFTAMPDEVDLYFVHSYHFLCSENASISGWADYQGRFTASVQKGNIYGTQFHPEKSQSNGLRVLKNFVELGRMHA